MKRQAEIWMDSASDDLLVIKEIIRNHGLTHMVAFHAQQAVEKSFKAVLEENEEEVPRTHNLISLKGRTEKYISIKIERDCFDRLNELYIDSRYPADTGLLPDGKPPPQTASDFFRTAETIYKKTREYLESR